MRDDEGSLLWEVRRLRDANHNLRSTVAGLEKKIAALEYTTKGLEGSLDEMRQRLSKNSETLDGLEEKIDNLSTAQELADELEARELGRRREAWTFREKVFATLVGASAIAANVGIWFNH